MSEFSELWERFDAERKGDPVKACANFEKALSEHVPDLISVKDFVSTVMEVEKFIKQEPTAKTSDPREVMAQWLRGEIEDIAVQ